MKHLFLPLPIETVRSAWEDWCSTNEVPDEGVQLVEVQGGCFVVTERGKRPPRVFIDLMKRFLSQKSGSLARAS